VLDDHQAVGLGVLDDLRVGGSRQLDVDDVDGVVTGVA